MNTLLKSKNLKAKPKSFFRIIQQQFHGKKLGVPFSELKQSYQAFF